MGMQPFMEDLKWRAMNWHYEFYMKKKADEALRVGQKSAAKLQWVADMKISGESRKGLNVDSHKNAPTKSFAFRSFVPNVVPHLASTNPFCPITANQTGWRECITRRIPDPLPRGKHFVSGTDDSVPQMPKVK